MGLFTQPDWFEVTEPGVGTNRYAYSFNDPINKMDPGGNQARVSGGGLRAYGPYAFGGVVHSPLGPRSAGPGPYDYLLTGAAVGASTQALPGDRWSAGVKTSSGSKEVDGVFGGFDDGAEPNGQSYPGTLEGLNEELSSLPGVKTNPRADGGTTITLPDGTKIDTYPKRSSDGKPGFAITKPGKRRASIKGSVQGENQTEERENSEQDQENDDEEDDNKTD